jgi:hypothetical protein
LDAALDRAGGKRGSTAMDDVDAAGGLWSRSCRLEYNRALDFTLKVPKIMEAERINALSALLADLTIREAELRRYL